MIGWLIAYLAVGLVSIALVGYEAERDGYDPDITRAIIAVFAWPVFAALAIGGMIAAANPKTDNRP